MRSSTALLMRCASERNEELLHDGVAGCTQIIDGEITAPKFEAVIKLSTSNLKHNALFYFTVNYETTDGSILMKKEEKTH